MITCFLRYQLNPLRVDEFEIYAKKWISLVNKLGGTHHGYFMPTGDEECVALALLSFPSKEDYRAYRRRTEADPECQAAMAYFRETECFLSFERTFFRPVFA